MYSVNPYMRLISMHADLHAVGIHDVLHTLGMQALLLVLIATPIGLPVLPPLVSANPHHQS